MTLPPLWSAETEARIRAAARDMDAQQRPETVTFCHNCVISNQRPRISFDGEGVCSACRYAMRKKSGIDWDARLNDLCSVVNRYSSKGRQYDVIVPCSGGKDSAFVAWRLKHWFGMTPLLVRWHPHLITEVGARNWQALNQHFDSLTIQPAGLLHRKLARLALEFIGDPFLPFIYGQLAAPMRVAVDKGIRLVMGGENGEAEYGGDTSANDKPGWDVDDWDRIYLKGTGVRDLLDLGRNLGAIAEAEADAASDYYRLPARAKLAEQRTEYRWLGYHLPWHPQSNYYAAVENYGFEANPERSEGTYSKYASIDDKLDGLHYYMGFIKFGIGRCTSDAAHEVRDGDISRDEAVALVTRYDGEWPERHMAECLDYLGMDREGLLTVFDRFRPAHLWEPIQCIGAFEVMERRKENALWRLKHSVEKEKANAIT